MRMNFGAGRWRGFALAAVVFLAGNVTAADPEAIRYYEDAVSRFNSGDSKGALIQLRNSLKRDPTQLPARVLIGRIHLDMGNPLQAEEELATAEKLGVDPVLTALPLAQARNRLHKYDDVVDSIRPGDYPPGIQADLWIELAKAKLGQGDGPGADAALAHALRLTPNNEQALLTQISSLLRQKKNAEAIAVGSEVLALYPQSAEAWFLMGSAHHAQGEYDSAAAHYRRARAIDPAQGRAALGEAMVLIATRQRRYWLICASVTPIRWNRTTTISG